MNTVERRSFFGMIFVAVVMILPLSCDNKDKDITLSDSLVGSYFLLQLNPVAGFGCEGLDAEVNFTDFQVYKNNLYSFTQTIPLFVSYHYVTEFPLPNCNPPYVVTYFDGGNPENLYNLIIYNYNDSSLRSALIYFNNDSKASGTIDGDLDNFTEIITGDYRFVPVR